MRKVLYILGQLSDTDTEWLAGVGIRQKVPAGTTLIQERRPVDAVYVVLEGRLAVSVEALHGETIAHLGPGEMVGEMSFVDARPPSASVKAEEDSLVLAIPRPALEERIRSDLGFMGRFYRALAVFLSDRLRGVTARLGYGEGHPLGAAVKDADELDDSVLDNVHLAGSRFDRLLRG